MTSADSPRDIDVTPATEVEEQMVPTPAEDAPAAAAAEVETVDPSDASEPESPHEDAPAQSSSSPDVPAEEPPAEPSAAEPAAKTPRPRAPKPRAPKPGAFAPATPAVVAAHSTHPVKVPVVDEVTAEMLAEAEAFGSIDGDNVVVTIGDQAIEVGPAVGDDPLKPFASAYYELKTSIERFHARLGSAELSVKDIDDALSATSASLATPAVVGDIVALRTRWTEVEAEATQTRERIQAERRAARDAALAAREEIVVQAEALAAKPEDQVHWKNDTESLRSLLDAWKEAQRSGARVPKEAERALWRRFTHARSSFEKARKHHFSQLDRDNAQVADHKEALVARAEALQTSTDWDSTARAFRDLMNEWRQAGRGRRSVDDALWRRFQTAQDAFFETRRSAAEAEDEALAGNVEAKEAIVVEAEALLPITDLRNAKRALRSLQDRFEAAGRVPRADAARLAKRIGAVEKAVRDGEDAEWHSSNPELEARVSGAAAQLHAAIADLEKDLEKATAAGDKRRIKQAEEALSARKAWLKQIENVQR
ncbi:DUF349 domain-containing protein [Demequina capsici]|uniref:DUF349 domain-containing protein n=1 Tax=Demequina capsici TaxID=3075620 RepID=A0AA96J8U2_9MICO|nr:DUF349 domain-containing protein [Demequina sp. OYTSA14]WNM25755.1 DUF349 domain-containing protein [Demequina sp. OYTSA14]